MQLFSCKVAVNGSKYNEVRKDEVTIPEILVLRAIHGGEESVTEIRPLRREAMDAGLPGTKPVFRNDKAERARLSDLYGGALKNQFMILFPAGVPLPQVADGIGEVITQQEPVRRTRRLPPGVKAVPSADAVLEGLEGAA